MSNPNTWTTDAMKTTSVCDPNIANENLEYLKYAADNIFVPADTTIYVATTGNDTTGDGTSSLPFATLQKALDYLNGKTLLGAVTIQLADGTYTSTSQILITHPQGDLITIQGNTSDRTKVILQFNGVTGFQVYHATFLNISWLTINGNQTADTLGIDCNGILNATQVVAKNFNLAGFSGIKSGAHINLTNCLATTNTSYGILVGAGASCYLKNVQATSNTLYGLFIYGCSFCVISGSSFTSNGSYGIAVNGLSTINMGVSTNSISGNTTGAIYADGNSIANASNATISGTLSPAANTFGNVNSYIYI